jgi:hypothetical protein
MKFEEILINSPEFKEGKYGEALKSAFHKVDTLLEDTVKYCQLISTVILPNF